MKIPKPGDQVFAGTVNGFCNTQLGISALYRGDFIAMENNGPVFAKAVNCIDDGNVGDRCTTDRRLGTPGDQRRQQPRTTVK